MSTIVLRATKGTPLTNTEVDANFSNLNTDKLQLGGTYSAGTANGILYLNASKVLTTGTALTYDGSKLIVAGTISETVGTTQYLVASQYDVGTAANQIPLNQYLGNMAFQDSASISVNNINAASQVLTIGNGQIVKDAAGNLGLGVTPSSWNANITAIDMPSRMSLFSGAYLSTAASWIGLNVYNNAGNKYKAPGYALQYGMLGADGSHRWYNAPLGTADAAITFNQAMMLDASSNLQVQAGAIVPWAPAPAAISTTATLTNANIQGQIINTTGTTYTVTMPLGTTMETLVPWAAVNLGYDFYVVNTASGTITMAVNTGVTNVGSLTIATGVSAHFRIRRTAANTFVLYRLS